MNAQNAFHTCLLTTNSFFAEGHSGALWAPASYLPGRLKKLLFRRSRGSSVGKCPFEGRCLGSRTEKSYCLRSAWAYFGKNSKFNPLLPVKPIKWSGNFDGQSFLCRVSVALALRVARSSQHHLASFFCITVSFSPPRFCSCGASRMETLLPQLGGDEQDDGLQVGQVRSEP